MKDKSNLAINGGPKVRSRPLPYRKLFGEAELDMVKQVFEDSWQRGVDFGYQGKYEEIYTKQFCEFQGGGFADAVSSGTTAVYLALKAMNIDRGSDVIVSPVTDPGSVAPAILEGMNIVIADAKPGSFNIGPEEFEKAITPNTRAAILTHTGGHPFDAESIAQIAASKKIKLIEDCSQAHGALCNGKRIGTFGDIAAFSTMFSKNHATGGCGGLVYTKDEEIYCLVRALSDRGKPFNDPNFNPKDPSDFLFPSLNYNNDELSCAIGISTLARLEEIIENRLAIANQIDERLKGSSVVFPAQRSKKCKPSIFFHTVEVLTDQLKVSKTEFAEAVAAEGIWINPNYQYVVSEWKWAKDYIKNYNGTPNAKAFRDSSFNILFNERFGEEDIDDVVSAIMKVESVFRK